MAATYLIKIVVSAPGAAAAVNGLTGQLKNASRAGQELNRILGAIGAAVSIRGILKLSDTYTQVTNRIRAVTSSQQELNLMTNATFKIAQQNRVAWEPVATTYARITRATKDMGLSQKDNLTIVDRVTKAIKINGSSTQEATSTLRQFGQALSKGKLNGDEFVSLMENARPIMELVAKSVGKTHGELFRMAKQGKLTGQVLVDAILQQGKVLDEQSSKNLPTFTERWVQLKNAATKAIGEIGNSSGVLSGLNSLLGDLVDNFDDLIRPLTVVIELLAYGFAVRAVGAVVSGLRAISLAMLTNPFTAIAVALGGLIVLAIEFRKELAGMAADMGKMSATGERTLNASGRSGIGPGMNNVLQQGTSAKTLAQVKEARELVDLFGGLDRARQKAKEDFNQDLADAVEIVERHSASMAKAAGRSFEEILGRYQVDVIDRFVKVTQDAIAKIQKITDDELMNRVGTKKSGPTITDAEIKKITSDFEKLREKTNDAAKVYYDLRDAQIALNKAIRIGIVDAAEAQIVYDKLRDSVADLNQVTAGAANPVSSGALFGAGNNIAKPSMDRTDLLLEQDSQRTKVNAGLEKQFELSKNLAQINNELNGKEQERINRLVAMNYAVANNIISQAQYNKLLKQLTEQDMLEGVQKLDQALVLVFNNATDALADFLYTGEFGFRKMVDSMLRDISRLLAQQLIMGALGAASGASYGNWIGTGAAMLGQKGFANGGSFMVGGQGGTDSQVVAFKATPGESVTIATPQQQKSMAGGGGATKVVNNITFDPRQMAAMLSTPAGQRELHNAIRLSPDIINRRTK